MLSRNLHNFQVDFVQFIAIWKPQNSLGVSREKLVRVHHVADPDIYAQY